MLRGWILFHEEDGEPMMIDLSVVRLIKKWQGRTILVHKDPAVYNIYISESVDTVYSMIKAESLWNRGYQQS